MTLTLRLMCSDRETRADEIRGICPPPGIKVLHVSAIELHLELNKLTEAEKRNAIKQGICSTYGTARPVTLGEVDKANSNLSSSLTLKLVCLQAIDDFLCWRPPRKAAICGPRKYRSCRLNELAPGVFITGLPRLIRTRLKLLSTIADILLMHTKPRRSEYEHSNIADDSSSTTDAVAQVQVNLWTSMLNELRYSHLQPSQQAQGSINPAQSKSHGPPQDGNGIPGQEDPAQSTINLANSNLSCFDEPFLIDDGSQEYVLPMPQNEVSLHHLATGLDCSISQHYGKVRSMDVNESQLPVRARQYASRNNYTVKETDDLEGFKTAEVGMSRLIHQDNSSSAQCNDLLDDGPAQTIGRDVLTQTVHSTGQHNRYEVDMDHESNHDILMLDELQPAMKSLTSQDFVLQHILPTSSTPFQLRSSEALKSSSSLSGIANSLRMNDTESKISLADVLGDDHFMWRRGSLAPAEHVTSMQNLYKHDPDMRILTSTVDDYAFDDSMLFGSFDWSREPSQSASSSERVSPDLTEEPPILERDSGHQRQQPKSLSNVEVTAKPKAKRRSSVLQKITRPPRMSEDDIVYQQSSPTRAVDIKKRKSLMEYHRSSK